MTRQSKWKWFGHAGHFIGGNSCRFHLCTQVGAFLVSTVGDYYQGGGDGVRTTLGSDEDSYFETYVFSLGAHPRRCSKKECVCGMPTPESWREIDGIRESTAGKAAESHMKMCVKYARKRSR